MYYVLVGLSIMLAFCGIVGLVYAVIFYKDKHKVASLVMTGLVLVAMFLVGITFPVETEEYTKIATIQGVGKSFTNYNAAYVEIDGAIEEISVGEYNRNMFSALTGHTVELTYGKIHTLLGLGEHWDFIDLQIPKN